MRLSISRGNGGLFDDDRKLNYVIECWSLAKDFQFNENGLVIGIFNEAQKNADVFANLKSANFLLYSMAAQYAKENKWNDCLVLNNHGRIADSTIANIFLVKDNLISTPALGEGCVNGVMRRHLLQLLPSKGFEVVERQITIQNVLDADGGFSYKCDKRN